MQAAYAAAQTVGKDMVLHVSRSLDDFPRTKNLASASRGCS